MIERLQRDCRQAGSRSEFARQAGIMPQHVSLVLKGKCLSGPKVLQTLGLTHENEELSAG
jgi:hypothetical protein